MDLFKPFRRCFLCRGKTDLLRVIHPGYNTTFHYYHQACLQRVIDAPEEHPTAIDTAIQITDQINEDRKRERQKRVLLQGAAERLRNVVLAVPGEVPQNADVTLAIPEIPQDVRSVTIEYSVTKSANDDAVVETRKYDIPNNKFEFITDESS